MLRLPCLLENTTSLQKVSKNSPRCSTSQHARTPRPLRHSENCRRSRTFAREAQPRQQESRSSPVQDAQDTELATADQQAKQDLYAQLLDRQRSSSSSEVSTSGDVAAPQPKPSSGQSGKGSTELIFRLERRGEGWGEEIFPHLVVEQRPWTTTAKRDRNRSSRPKPWTANTLLATPSLLKHSPPVAAGLAPRHALRPLLRNVCTAALSASSPDEPAEPAVHAGQQEGSAEQFLLRECGIDASKVDGIITDAVAWRVTPGGRQLIDRRRRSRIERNMLQCAEYLIKECGIEPGSKGVGQIFAKVPQIMLCKPSTNDRWDRRVVQLAAFMHRHGHCNVPEGWVEAPDLAKWVRRQRVARAQGALSEERLQVLYAMGFEFGEVAQLTAEWEAKFDQLIEWLLWQDQDDGRKQGFSWLGFDWGRKGGLQARELALWVQLQREFRRRNLLGTDAIKRLEAIGFIWEPEAGGQLWQHKWMHQLGKLLYIVERNRKISAAVASQSSQRTYSLQTNQTPSLGGVQPDPPGLPRSAPGAPQDLSIDIVTQRPALRASGQSVSRGFPPPYPSRYSPQGSRVGPQAGLKQTVSKGANALQRQIAKRRAALASAHLEAGQGFWLAKQRWLWRRGRLSREQFLMLQLAGLEMDIHPPLQWKRLAHETAHYLHGSQIHPDQDFLEGGATPEGRTASVGDPIKQPAGPSLPRAKGRPRKLAHQPEGQPMHQQQAVQPQYSHQHALPVQSPKWQPDMSPPHMYAIAHTSSRGTLGSPSLSVQQPQLHFRQLVSTLNPTPAAASTRASSSASNGSSSAALDEDEELPSSGGSQQQAGVRPPAESGAATAVAAPPGSLYACTPPGRPPGRRLAVVRWVLNQRALWRDGQLTPVQMQYMTILGVTWLLSSKVVQMVETTWLEQLQAFSQQVAAVGQQVAAEQGRLADWFLHQQGLFALGFLPPRRVKKLNELGVSWQPIRTDADILWDARLTELLSFRREHGHVQVLAGSAGDQSLASWLGVQCKLMKQGLLSSARASQLLALGVKPDMQT